MTFKTQFLLKIMLATTFVLFGCSGLAANKPVNTDRSGVAINGYDPVAYFTKSKAVKGDTTFTYEWQEAKWQFSSAENMALFKAEPEKYAPQYGGFCAYAVSHNYTAKVDPEAWKIVDGKLYLNYNASIQKKWENEQTEFIEAADKNWPELRGEGK